MSSEATNQPELTCQWCSGTIPENESACSRCGSARPREDLVVTGNQTELDEPVPVLRVDEALASQQQDEEARARQILKDLDVYIPEDASPPRATVSSSAADDIPMVLGILAVSAIMGGLLGWFLAPPLLHNIFNDMVGVDTDGPESFRRLGAFLGALTGLLFGALLGTSMRR